MHCVCAPRPCQLHRPCTARLQGKFVYTKFFAVGLFRLVELTGERAVPAVLCAVLCCDPVKLARAVPSQLE